MKEKQCVDMGQTQNLKPNLCGIWLLLLFARLGGCDETKQCIFRYFAMGSSPEIFAGSSYTITLYGGYQLLSLSNLINQNVLHINYKPSLAE